MTTDELNAFWDARDIKIWIVTLYGTGRKKGKTDRLCVMAKGVQGALKCAKNNSIIYRNKPCSGHARYADPISDLHCVPAK